MKKGHLVLIPFPYTDLTGIKNRPVLILINSENDVTVAFISSQIKSGSDLDIELNPTSTNGLKKISLIKVTKLATIEKDLILGELGSLSPEEMKIVDERLISVFQLSPIK